MNKLLGKLPIISQLTEIRNGVASDDTLRDLFARYLSIETIKLELALSQDPRYGDPKRLLKSGLQSNSQNFEDGMIWEVFRRIGTTNKVFVEIGVESGIECNSALLLSLGWTGFWIDGGREMIRTIEERPDLRGHIQPIPAFVDAGNIVKVLKDAGVPHEIDFLSVDIDQNTYYVLEALKGWNARLIVVEYNAAIPADADWKANYDPTRVWDTTQNYGASLKAYENLLTPRGYRLVGCDLIGLNAFFVRADLTSDKFREPFTSENHYEPLRYAIGVFRRGHRRSIMDRAMPQ